MVVVRGPRCGCVAQPCSEWRANERALQRAKEPVTLVRPSTSARGSVFRCRRVRREALLIRVEVRDLRRLPRRSGEVELWAARAGW